jgi:hypothetical protein
MLKGIFLSATIILMSLISPINLNANSVDFTGGDYKGDIFLKGETGIVDFIISPKFKIKSIEVSGSGMKFSPKLEDYIGKTSEDKLPTCHVTFTEFSKTINDKGIKVIFSINGEDGDSDTAPTTVGPLVFLIPKTPFIIDYGSITLGDIRNIKELNDLIDATEPYIGELEKIESDGFESKSEVKKAKEMRSELKKK